MDPSAASITVHSGGTLTINSTRTLSCKLIVYGTLNITGGKLNLGNNDVFLAEGATVTGASSSSYFVTNGTGVVTKIIAAGSSFEFPVSPNTSSYNALTINNTSGPIEVYSVRGYREFKTGTGCDDFCDPARAICNKVSSRRGAGYSSTFCEEHIIVA